MRKVELKKVARQCLIVNFIGLAIVTTGCGVLAMGDDHTQAFDDGFISIRSDARGMRAFGQAMNGLITNGKASPDVDTPYYLGRREEEQEITKRTLIESQPAPQGIWQRLWNTNSQPAAAAEVAK